MTTLGKIASLPPMAAFIGVDPGPFDYFARPFGSEDSAFGQLAGLADLIPAEATRVFPAVPTARFADYSSGTSSFESCLFCSYAIERSFKQFGAICVGC
jgi:hypothetical protein